MPKFDTTIVFMPNACDGPPHIGHLWMMLHTRYLHSRLIAENGGSGLWHGAISPQWRIAFDTNSTPENETAFHDMAVWAFGKDVQVDRLADWESPALHSIPMMLRCERRLPGENHFWMGQFDPTGAIAKLLYFNQHRIHWHMRGTELYILEREEHLIANEYQLARPFIWYVPLLLDEAGNKIGGPNVSYHYSSRSFMRRGAEEVVIDLMRAIGASEEKTHRGSGMGVEGYIDQFYPRRLGFLHEKAEETIVIADHWQHHEGHDFDDPQFGKTIPHIGQSARPVLDAPSDADIHTLSSNRR